MNFSGQRSLSVHLETCPEGYRWRFMAMGTQWEIIVCDTPHDDAVEWVQRTVRWAHGFEARYSRFRPDSLISHLNRRAGSGERTELNRADRYVLERADEAVFTTGALVDPTALPLCLLWDFRRDDLTPPSPHQIEKARELVGWQNVELGEQGVYLPREGMGLDFGGFGKELAVDQLGQMLMAQGVSAGLVNGGGDIAAWGHPPKKPAWHIELEDPTQTSRRCGFALGCGAVASSGHHHRFFRHEGRHYSHLIDPRNGRPSQSPVRAASVHAPTCFQAGLFATISCLLPVDEALDRIGSTPLVEGCLFTPFKAHSTSGFLQHSSTILAAS